MIFLLVFGTGLVGLVAYELIERKSFLAIPLLLGVILMTFSVVQISYTRLKKRLVKEGKAEYYLDKGNKKQWRIKEVLAEEKEVTQ